MAIAVALFLPLAAGSLRAGGLQEDLALAERVVDRFGWGDLAEEILDRAERRTGLSAADRTALGLARIAVLGARVRAAPPEERPPLVNTLLARWNDLSGRLGDEGSLDHLQALYYVAEALQNRGKVGGTEGLADYRKSIAHLEEIFRAANNLAVRGGITGTDVDRLGRLIYDAETNLGKAYVEFAELLPEGDERTDMLEKGREHWLDFLWARVNERWEKGERDDGVALSRAWGLMWVARCQRRLGEGEEAVASIEKSLSTLEGRSGGQVAQLLREVLSEYADVMASVGRAEAGMATLERIRDASEGAVRGELDLLMGEMLAKQADILRETDEAAAAELYGRAAALVEGHQEGNTRLARRARQLARDWKRRAAGGALGASEFLDAAERLWEGQDVAAVRAAARQVIPYAPTAPDLAARAWFLIGASYYEDREGEAGHFLEAALAFGRAVDVYPEGPKGAESSLWECRALMRGLRPLGMSEHPEVRRALGRLVGNYADALRGDPDSAGVVAGFTYEYGRQLYAARDYDGAVRALQRIPPDAENYSDALQLIGAAEFSRFKEIERDAEKVAEAGEARERAVAAFEAFLDWLARNADAIPEGKRATLKRMEGEAVYRLVILLIDGGAYERAGELLDGFEARFPSAARDFAAHLHFRRMQVFCGLGDPEEADRHYARLTAIDSEAAGKLAKSALPLLARSYQQKIGALGEGNPEIPRLNDRWVDLQAQMTADMGPADAILRTIPLVRARMGNGQFREAIDQVTEVVEQFRDIREEEAVGNLYYLMQLRARAAVEGGFLEEAIGHFEGLNGHPLTGGNRYLYLAKMADAAIRLAEQSVSAEDKVQWLGKAGGWSAEIEQVFRSYLVVEPKESIDEAHRATRERGREIFWESFHRTLEIFLIKGEPDRCRVKVAAMHLSLPDLGGGGNRATLIEYLNRAAVQAGEGTAVAREARTLIEAIRSGNGPSRREAPGNGTEGEGE